ncbi:SDR family NAD(P)-dependent oxidoreductase [Mucilaginibacter ginsenosidivorax]|uniref:SDR family NAD(P)-dependent oxidoreductase n=1 Tax=Mucilaginibacter ginsenosidivorax TaxID=862126 RepID=A0A5B8VZ54_9SPHI|nr:SDR family NAD(P)-dependent oxidoreductase [Mucilaginibacter ginsenosidivorax]QEC75895.1 SDR family NAD(P)-dependent oxidoreductase [Mucilaginibacter ginsenosidivorax]
MDLKLKGKRALITGSSAGLGEAIARLLAAEGAQVTVHGRNEARSKSVAESIMETGGLADYITGDLSTDEGADKVAQAVLAGGQVDILVNNVGTYQPQPWLNATVQNWNDTYNNNVLSYVRMIHRLLPQMKTLGWGRIIQIGSSVAIQPMTMQPDYSASAAARHNLSVSLARELKGTGITSNTVSPGAMLVDTTRNMLLQMAQHNQWGSSWAEIEKNAVAQFTPNDTERLGRPEEIAGAVAYLASPYANYISGAVIRVDGGLVLSL